MRVFATAVLAMLLGVGSQVPCAQADDKKEKSAKLAEQAAAAYEKGKFTDAITHGKEAIELDPKNVPALFVVGSAYLKTRQNDLAATAFRNLIALNHNVAAAHDGLGDALLKSGHFKESVAAFDAFLKLRPQAAANHWRRGIALYYAGRFKDGADQFNAADEKAREDVENSAWHYLCNARASTPKKARADLIVVTKDGRVPMKQVLELFAGKLKPQDVIDATEKSGLKGEELKAARFYARLYIALYFESEGNEKRCREYLKDAVENYKIGHYMWDVAAVHLKQLKK